MDHDPWHWDTGQIETFFRSEAADILPPPQRTRLPSNEDFFEALRSEGVTGDCLLTAIDVAALRDEYGVKSAMARTAVWSCICKLRGRSIAYATQHGLPTLQAQTPRSLPPTNLPESPAQQTLEPIAASVEEDHPEHRPGENARSGEYEVQDARGRKRRKLNLSKAEPLENGGPVAKPAKNYLPESAVSVDEIFYGRTGFGEQIDTLPPVDEITVLEADREDDLEDNDFQFYRQNKTNGEVEFVYKCMQYFLKDAEVKGMTRQGRDAAALLPYAQKLSGTQSATVVQFTGPDADHPVAFRENVAYLNSTVPEKHADGGGEWDFLTDKYAADEGDVLPEYGDSETAPSEDRPTSGDTDGDGVSMAEESLAADELSVERAAELIDETITTFADKWFERVPRLEKQDAYKVWKKMKGSRTLRRDLIESAEAQIEHLRGRLKKQKAMLLESQWKSEGSLEQVCGGLKATVDEIEYQKWAIDVWGRRQEPWHEKRAKKHHGRAEQHGRNKTDDVGQPRLVIPDYDRFSVSLPPADPANDDTNATAAQDNVYEADDEFHTPVDSPTADLQSPDAFAGAEQSADEDDGGSDPFIVADDPVDEPIMDDAEDSGAGNRPDNSQAASGVDSDELPSPSNFVSNRVKPEQQLLSTPSNKRIMSIDLTGDSPSSEAPTPTTKQHAKSPINYQRTADPDGASAQDIRSWSYQELVKYMDRRRILLKILLNAGKDKRDSLHECFMSLPNRSFVQQLTAVLRQLQDEDISGFDDDRDDPLRLAAGIYLRWHVPELLTTAAPSDIPWKSVLEQNQISTFSLLLRKELLKKDTPRFSSPKSASGAAPGSSSANALVLSSSDNEAVRASQQTPHKKRKREVQRSQVAQGNRAKAFERMERANLAESQSAAADSSQLAAMIEVDPANSNVFINSLKEDDQDNIYVTRKIAAKMKQHQIDGARFLWREITAADDDGGHGCVLAHTMGLGKTMQTIAFLAAVNEAAQSKKQAVKSQLPKHLRPKKIRGVRSLRSLILCPAGLIQNWDREINSWAKNKLGNVYCLDAGVPPARRPRVVSDWMQTGGTLIVGYDLFRSMVIPSTTDKPKKKTPISDEDAEALTKNLLEGPEVVVADEAHNLRNEKSDIAKATKRFKTESRIALTGTPMSNDVQEVYALVSWVSPDYLGDASEFRAVFAEPIKEGLYAESTRYEQRKSIMKLKVLHKEIQPKVNRANIEALRGSIPPKVEFVIFVSLKEDQKELYCRYIRAVKAFIDADKTEDGAPKTSQVVFMSMLSVLTLLTGHPACFRDKLLEPPKEKKANASKEGRGDGVETESDAGGETPSTASGSASPLNAGITTAEQLLAAEAEKFADEHISAQGLTPEIVAQILDGDGSDIGTDPALSSKISIFLKLLRTCLRAKDYVIVFSQRISILDYLGHLLKREKIYFGRIDGSNMKQRMSLLEQFNNGDFSVILVSTKAGGVGLNMQCANRVFIFDSGFNPTYEEQAIGRAYRLGQKKPVYVYRFVAAGTFETNIYNKQLFKTSLAQRVVDKKNPRRTAERNTREYLYEPREVPEQDITEHIGKDPEVLGELLNQHGEGKGKFDTMIRDVKTMETLTEEIMDEPLDIEEQRAVEQETEARKQRPRGRKAVAAAMMAAPPSTMPAVPTWIPPAPRAPNLVPPPSTLAGPSNRPQHPPPTFLGGLPTPRRT